jgi:hypothetical protein
MTDLPNRVSKQKHHFMALINFTLRTTGLSLPEVSGRLFLNSLPHYSVELNKEGMV